jgi:hypothetical protein
MEHAPSPIARFRGIASVGPHDVITLMPASSPDLAPNSHAIEEALAEHRGEPVRAVRIGYEQWNAFCRERRVQPDDAWDLRFLGFPVGMDDQQPTGVRLLTEG